MIIPTSKSHGGNWLFYSPQDAIWYKSYILVWKVLLVMVISISQNYTHELALIKLHNTTSTNPDKMSLPVYKFNLYTY